MLSTRQRILALAMASVGAFAWWLHQSEEAPGPEEGDRERRPDYTVDNFSATTMDEFGVPHRYLTAIELRHYADDNSKELQTPDLTLYVKTGPPWRIRSETAWISDDNNLTRMQGKVHVDREAGPTTRPVRMRTRDMLLKRDENYAQTDQPVRITSEADWMTSGNGAEVWLGKQLRVKLSGPVRSEMAISRDGQENTSGIPNGRPRRSQ